MFRALSIGAIAAAVLGIVAIGQETRPHFPVGRITTPLVVDADAPVKPSKYWLGFMCLALPEALRLQMNLPEKQGLLVGSVVPDSPAAKAGITQHDVLLRAGDKVLSDPRELIEIIDATKEGKLKLELIHAGKPKTIEVTPAKRPADAKTPGLAAPSDMETIQKWLQGMGVADELVPGVQRPSMGFRVMRPGAIVPHDALPSMSLPANMTIIVTREGDQPAKIVVKRGEEKWELTEKDLDKLPADVRPHVERMLGRGLMGIVGNMPAMDFDWSTGAGPDAKVLQGRGIIELMEKRFDEMNRRMDKMFKQIEDLNNGQLQPPKPAAKPAEKK